MNVTPVTMTTGNPGIVPPWLQTNREGVVPPWLGDPRDLVPLPGPDDDEFVILPIDEGQR